MLDLKCPYFTRKKKVPGCFKSSQSQGFLDFLSFNYQILSFSGI